MVLMAMEKYGIICAHFFMLPSYLAVVTLQNMLVSSRKVDKL